MQWCLHCDATAMPLIGFWVSLWLLTQRQNSWCTCSGCTCSGVLGSKCMFLAWLFRVHSLGMFHTRNAQNAQQHQASLQCLMIDAGVGRAQLAALANAPVEPCDFSQSVASRSPSIVSTLSKHGCSVCFVVLQHSACGTSMVMQQQVRSAWPTRSAKPCKAAGTLLSIFLVLPIISTADFCLLVQAPRILFSWQAVQQLLVGGPLL
jgi:hypothetical protein